MDYSPEPRSSSGVGDALRVLDPLADRLPAALGDQGTRRIASALLVVLAVVVIISLLRSREGFSAYPTLRHTRASETGNNWSNWQFGADHAGWGGSMDRPTGSALPQMQTNADWKATYGYGYTPPSNVDKASCNEQDGGAQQQASALSHMGAYAAPAPRAAAAAQPGNAGKGNGSGRGRR